jgi:hypothetical protein
LALNARTGWKNFIAVVTKLLNEEANLRTKKHKGVLLSASLENSRMEPIKPMAFEEDSFSAPSMAEPSRAKSGVAIILLSFAFVASLGLVYFSVDAMLSGSNVLGLMGISDPTLTYRVGLVLAALSCFTIAAIAAMNVTR